VPPRLVPCLSGGPVALVVNQDLSACSAVSAVKAAGRCRCHSAIRNPRSALPATARGGQVRRLNGQPLRPPSPDRLRRRSLPSCVSLGTPHSALPGTATAGAVAGRTLNSCSRLYFRPQVSPGFRFPGLPASGGFPVPRSRLRSPARVSPGFLFPVPCSPFPAFGSYPQRRMPMRPCKNRQIRVKIDQKGDVFRQKGIKKARIPSCPS